MKKNISKYAAIRLAAKPAAEIKAYCKANGLVMGWLVTTAIKQYIKRNPRRKS